MGDRITFTGLSTGIDFQSIIDATMLTEQRRIDLVMESQAEEAAKLMAIQSFNGLLLGLLTSSNSLSDQNDFQLQAVTSSHESLLSASVAGNAALGTHSLVINRLAQAHQVASQGFADTDITGIGVGTVAIQVGSGATITIDIDAGNNTLEGLRDAINNSDANVSATIINDGSAENPYRLLLTGGATGAANTIDVTVSLTGGTAPDFTNNSIDSVEVDPGNSITYSGTASTLGTYTGTSNQTFIVEILSDGAVGVATYRFSTDGGQTFDDNGGAGYLTSELGTLLGDGVSIAFTDSGTLTTGDRFDIDVFVPTIQVAQDASVTIGSASGGGAPITIASESNTLTEIISGVTLNLLAADPSTTVRVSVENDTEAIRVAIEGFVESYNAVIDFLNDQLRFDTVTEQGGLLIGDSLLVAAQNDLRRIATDVISGLPTDLNRLSAIGITSVPETGRLTLNGAELSSALTSDPQGVANLFSTSSSSTNSDITFVNSTDRTATPADGFTVNITNAATRGTLEGGAIAGFPLTLTSSNNQLRLIVDGTESSLITLPAQTYASGEALAAEIQAQLNADAQLAGRGVSVEFTGSGLLFTSSSYGSSSTVELGTEPANSAFGALGLTGAISATGQDVAGTINGESATGNGQILTGDRGNATSAGLTLLVTLTEAEIDTQEPEGVVSLIDGIAARVSDLLDALTDPIDGRLVNRTNTLTRQMDEFDEDILRMEALLEERRLSLIDDFARLEASLALLNSQGDFLIQQLANLPRIDTLTRRNND
jgi:flagellar hook-associated protein 2